MREKLQKLYFHTLETSYVYNELSNKISNFLNCHKDLKFVLVKQDVQDDLYCCPPNSTSKHIVTSTLMRSGPVALFTKLGANFLVVETDDAPECTIWKEKVTELKWYELKQLTDLRSIIPGRNYGQAEYAQNVSAIDWSEFDVVISLDISIPERITRQHPGVLFCYYVREPKTTSYKKSLLSPLPGQDVFLTQGFQISRTSIGRTGHIVDFPYYFQYFGCFHDLLNFDYREELRNASFFLEHHTPATFSHQQIEFLESMGKVDSTSFDIDNRIFENYNNKSQKSPIEIFTSLLSSKYFISLPYPRNLFGNAAVEAISCGCLVIGNPNKHINNAFFTRNTSASTPEEAINLILFLESNPKIYWGEVKHQRKIINYLCYLRPLYDLIQAVSQKQKINTQNLSN